ncbi:MAG: glycosyltransferase [Pseudomonadota bacterium]|jgi:hypothetical protein
MRILLINQNWFAPELRSMGHEVLTCGLQPHLEYRLPKALISIDELLTELPNGFAPDRIVWLDNSGPSAVLGLEDCDIPCTMYSVDTHHHYVRHSAIATGFDHVCIAQKDLIPYFNDSETPTSWLPLWASEYVEASDSKRYGAVFVGTLNRQLNPARVAFFEAMQQLISIEVLEGHFPSIFPNAEIVLNQTVKGDLNFRVFEAMMCGALLITERSGNGLLELFEDGKHLITYTPQDSNDAAGKVSSLLAIPKIMRRIAQQGRDEILAKHQAIHRACELDDILRRMKKRAVSPHRHYGATANLSSASISLEKRNFGLSHYASSLAIQSALRALREGAQPSAADRTRIIGTCLRHDMLFRDGLGNEALEVFADAVPDHSIFLLLKLRSLLNKGKLQEARAFAQTVAADISAEDAFHAAEHAAAVLIEQLPLV